VEDNLRMVISGRVQNGVVIPEGNVPLPEGAVVTITFPLPTSVKPSNKKRIQLPLVVTGNPGSVNLTNERIGEILDEEDAAPRH
jgi:hypothetical protein